MKELKLDLKPLIRRLNVLERGLSTSALAGNYKSVFKGKGLEFEGYREYTPIDDASLIDWVASLRAQKKLVRNLVEERNVSVFFLFDVSNSMLFSTIDKLKCEYAAELIAALSFSILESGDNVGLGMFSDKLVQLILPAIGRQQYFKIVKALSDPRLYGGNFRFNKVISSLMGINFLTKNTILFIVSDFIGLKGDWKRSLEIVSGKFEIVSFIIRDPIDLTMPSGIGQAVLSNPYSSERMLVDPNKVREDYEQRVQNQINELNGLLAKLKSTSLLLRTDKSFVTPLLKFFKFREKRYLT